jgi:uncharacterized protein
VRFKRFGDDWQVRLESGDALHDSLVRLAAREGIGFAAFSGLGAVRSASVAYYNVETRAYETLDVEEQLEVTSLVGNVSIRDGQPFVHAHANLGRRDLSVFGGHLMAAVAHSTLEIWVTTQADRVERLPDEETGLALLELPEAG